GAVGELTRVAGGDDPALDRRADFRDSLVSGVGPNAFIGGDGDLLRRHARSLLVGDAHDDFHGHDLVAELARGQRRGGSLLAARAVLVLALPRNVVALGDGLRG